MYVCLSLISITKYFKMKRIIFTLLISVFSASAVILAQTLDEEIGFIYVKAEYLYETGRYDDAVNQYNLVIRQDPKFKDALIKRGMAKNALGAYKGGKLDVLQYIDLVGITGAAAAALARAELGMNQNDAALNSYSAAIGMEPGNIEYLETRAKIYEESGQLLKACADWERAMKAGSAFAESRARSLCGITKTQKPSTQRKSDEVVSSGNPTNPSQNETPVSEVPEQTVDQGQQSNPVTETNTDDSQENTEDAVTEPEDDPTIPKEDNYRNVLGIDDDLVIEIYGHGLGRRGIKEVPSILILSDEDGIVSLDVCVNNKGEVTKAEFNPSLSTTAKKSLVSLAIRKSREFIFDRAIYPIQCGVMQFKIKGS
jgi:tetratricopeptide (TPR) repeat protein